MTGTVDKINFTMSGYQQTTIDGVVYATAFDFADLPALKNGSRVEYERTGQRAQDHVLQLAYPGGNLIGGLIERGDPNVKAALGRLGPSAPWPGKILPNPRLPSFWSYGHTDYMTTDLVPEDFTLPVNVPDPTILALPSGMVPAMAPGDSWKPCWSPAYTATRWQIP